jgi:predicted MFS family arabinose efflux permease
VRWLIGSAQKLCYGARSLALSRAIHHMLRSIIAAYRAAFAGLSRECWILSLVAFVNRSGTMVLPFLALYLKRERGFTAEEAGQLIAVYGLGSMLGSYAGGLLSDLLSPKRVQVGSLILGGLMFFVLGRLSDPTSIAVALFAAAAINDALRPANMAAIANASTPETRTRAFGLNRLAINLGVTIGPALGGFLAVRDYSFLFVVDGGTCITAGVLMLVLSKGAPPRAPSAPGAPTTSPWTDLPFLGFLFFSVISGLVFFQLESSFPLYLNEHYGLPEDRIGLMYAVNTIMIVVLEMLLVRRIESWPLLRTIALGVVLTGVGFGLLPWGSSVGFVVLTVVVWTWGEMLSAPAMGSYVSSRASEENRGRYMGLFNISFALGFVIAPLAGTAIYSRYGGDYVWHVALATSIVAAAGLVLVERLTVSPPTRAPDAAGGRSPTSEDRAA